MSTAGEFGNPLRKFKLVFLGEQSGKKIFSRESERFFSNVLIVAYNSSLERSHPKDSKTGFIFVVGQILKILHHF